MGITFAIGCKPAGMFNLSADYYQSFIRWKSVLTTSTLTGRLESYLLDL